MRSRRVIHPTSKEAQTGLVVRTKTMQTGDMRTTIDLDSDMARGLAKAMKVIGEKQATVLRMAIRQGLPILLAQHQAPRSEGFFASAYTENDERLALEDAYGRQLMQQPER